jgi:hypothetical protein
MEKDRQKKIISSGNKVRLIGNGKGRGSRAGYRIVPPLSIYFLQITLYGGKREEILAA